MSRNMAESVNRPGHRSAELFDMPAPHRVVHMERTPGIARGGDVAAIYNQAGDGYAAYADGDADRLFAFDGLHSYADRTLWRLLDAKLMSLRRSGRNSIRILDAGCGPGTWLRRLVTRAHALGFTDIRARGFDIAEGQIERARLLSRGLGAMANIDLEFAAGDLSGPLQEADGTIDLTLCLYSVLSHLPVAALPRVCAELARVTSGYLIITVRPVGSPPSVFVDSIEKACRFKQDNDQNQCDIELSDGRRFTLAIHLFTALELRGYFAGSFEIEAVRGLDLFHSRFMLDPRWNPALATLSDDDFDAELSRIEDAYASTPAFIEHAAHLLLVAHGPAVESATTLRTATA